MLLIKRTGTKHSFIHTRSIPQFTHIPPHFMWPHVGTMWDRCGKGGRKVLLGKGFSYIEKRGYFLRQRFTNSYKQNYFSFKLVK